VNRVRVKICGITRRKDAIAAINLGADALGLNFYGGSKRFISLEAAEAICHQLPPLVTRVGLFVDPSEEEVSAVLSRGLVDLLQFHGGETDSFCQQFDFPYMKAIRVSERMNEQQIQELIDKAEQAAAVLLDTYVEGVPGGTGEVFDWRRVPRQAGKPIVMAGGLNSSNVAEVIRQVKPFAVDLSGGVEDSPGIKNHQKMAAFMREVAIASAAIH